MKHKDLEVCKFKDLDEWAEWLENNFDKYPKGIWVKIAKKGSGVVSTSYEDIREGCLIYGWIDGLVNKLDDKEFLLRVTPRRPKGMWSKINCVLVEELIKGGKMRESGLLEIVRAKQDGRWEAAYPSPKDMHVPQDFIDEIKKDEQAWEFYKTLNRVNTYAIAFRLHTARTQKVREKRLHELSEMMKRKRKLY